MMGATQLCDRGHGDWATVELVRKKKAALERCDAQMISDMEKKRTKLNKAKLAE